MIYLTYKNSNGEEVPVDLHGLISNEININQYYLTIYNKHNGKYYYLNIIGVKDTYITLLYLDSIPQFKDYEYLKLGLTKNYPRGFNTDDQNSLFRSNGYVVTNLGNTDDTKWEIEINFPYYLLKDCYLNPMMYYPGTVFFIQEKMQITYTFRLTYNVKDYDIVSSGLNDSGLF